MKKIIFLFAILLNCGHMHAANLHAIIVCDTKDESIGESVKKDYHLLEHHLQMISSMTLLKLQKKVFVGKQAKPANVLNAIKELNVGKNDVIFFYFSGHGFRFEEKEDELPYIHFGEEDLGCDFLTITQELVDKEPRLLISLSDCCNSEIPKWDAPPIVKNKFLKRQYIKLFLESDGVLVGTAATQKEYAHCDRKGGFFTHAFFKSLEREMRECERPSWDTIISRSADQVKYITFYEQHPRCHFIKMKPSKWLDLRNYM